MLNYILKRLFIAIPLLILVSIVSFSTLTFYSDPARAITGQRASAETLERIRTKYHLNKPLHQQYLIRVKGLFLEGRLGESMMTGEPVLRELARRFSGTLELTLAAMIIALAGGLSLGILSAVRPRSLVDHVSLLIALFGVSVPVFFLGILLVNLFSGRLGWFPVSGRLPVQVSVTDYSTSLYVIEGIVRGDVRRLHLFLNHLFLPAVTLSTIPMAIITRITRSSMLEVLQSGYIRTARAKGVSNVMVLCKHALRNAMIDITTISGAQMGYLLGGAVLTETVFSWPGLGRYLVERIQAGDFIAVQGGLFVTASVFVLINLAVDLSYAIIDPRVRYEKST